MRLRLVQVIQCGECSHDSSRVLWYTSLIHIFLELCFQRSGKTIYVIRRFFSLKGVILAQNYNLYFVHHSNVLSKGSGRLPFIKSEITNQRNHSAKNFHIIHNNSIHVVIFRLQTIMTVLFVERLNGRFASVHQSNNNLTIFRNRSLLHNDNVTVQNTDIDHTLTTHT